MQLLMQFQKSSINDRPLQIHLSIPISYSQRP